MKAFGGFLLVLLVAAIIVSIVGVISYNHEMAPTWAEIQRQQALLDIAIAKQNAQSDIASHNQRNMAMDAGFWTAVLLMISFGGVFVWAKYDTRQESKSRMVDGSFALQRETSNGRNVYLDPNKPAFGAIGFDRVAGTVLTDAEMFGPDRQLEYANNVQRTRTVSAKQIPERQNRTTALADAGYFDAKTREAEAKAQLVENRLIAQAPADPDGDPMAIEPILTLKQAVAQSTPDAWIVGQNQETGKLAYFKPNEAIHLAILGATGTGKTESTGMLIVGYALRNGYRTMILDGKGGADWRKFERWCEYIDTDNSNFVEALQPIQSEYERRCELLRFEEAPAMQPMLVLIEEYGDINDTMTPKARTAATLILDTLIRKARNTGIHLCFIDQYPEKWERQLLNNTKNKVVYWLNNGNIVNEYHVHKLAENGEFMLKGQKYAAWHVKPMVKNFLADVPAVQYPPLSVRPSVEDEGGGIPLVADKRTDGQADITNLQAAVLQWRRDNPEGIQADCIRAMAAQGLTLSRQYASDLWKIQLDASPMAWQEEGEDNV